MSFCLSHYLSCKHLCRICHCSTLSSLHSGGSDGMPSREAGTAEVVDLPCVVTHRLVTWYQNHLHGTSSALPHLLCISGTDLAPLCFQLQLDLLRQEHFGDWSALATQ